MTQTYFSNFPTIEYANTFVRDITRRVIFPAKFTDQVVAFYPYDLTNDQRSDVLAYNYYADTDADWLIYLVNGIIDPYYGWYLNYDNFNNSIIDKYGNLVDPQQRIKYWQTNWSDDDTNATTSYYNSLPAAEQKYWTPVWGANDQIIFYTRREVDWFMNTNQIWTLEVANNAAFGVANLVSSSNTSEQIEGTGEVVGQGSDGVTVIIKDIANTFTVGSSLQLFTNALANSVISSVSITQINIPLSEAVYWEPVTYFEWEEDKNEQNKSLLLMDRGYLSTAAQTLKASLQANT